MVALQVEGSSSLQISFLRLGLKHLSAILEVNYVVVYRYMKGAI